MRKLLFLRLFVLVGCGVTALTPEGRTVRQIEPAWANKCKFLGVKDVDVPYKEVHETRRASFINAARNVTASVGGDAFVVTNPGKMLGLDGQIDAYDCSMFTND